MKQYFSANQLHLEGPCMIDAAPRVPLLATYGIDNFVFTTDPTSENKTQYQIQGNEFYTAMALAPDGSHCLFASRNTLLKYEFASRTLQKMAEDVCNGDIKVLRYAASGGFVAVGGEDGKPVVFQPRTGRKQKCRPGHTKAVASIFLSRDDQFLGSIGQDQNVAIFQLSSVEQPREVARYPITHLQDCTGLSASFHFSKSIVYLPGERFLQTIQLLNGRWQFIRLQKVSHGENVILLSQTVKENTLVSSSEKEVCIWNLSTQEKLFEIEQFSLNVVVPAVGSFFGVRGDGLMYRYIREIKEEEPMEIQEERPEDRIEFEEAESEQGENQSEGKKSEVEFQVQKKSKADKIITCLPQAPVTSSTSVFDGQRFLFANEHGCVIERLQANEQKTIEVEFGLQNPKKMIISHGRQMIFFDLNPFALIYATEKQFGVKILPGSEGQSKETTWNNIKSIALGCGWLAVANEQQIKLFDICLHEIRTIAFDRQIIALRAHQNMLCVVYHESVPMWGSQQLAMQLILVDSSMKNANMLSSVQVPVRPGSILRSFHFSQEGMLISQDSSGALRAFSLERGDWTPVGIVGLQDTRKAWIIGVVNMNVLFWKTSNEDPEPTVAPRFAIKSSSLYIPTIGAYPKETQQAYEQLLWARFALDHEKARARLWGRLKTSRDTKSNYYYLVSSIISEKEIAVRHQELDQKFFNLVQSYLKQDQPLRALALAKSCLRTIESTRKLVELFDYFNKRQLAIQLEEYCEERQRQLEYEQMQIFEFMKMREAAERTIKPRSQDPMRRGTKRISESIPSFSQNMSQESIDGVSSVAKITGSQASHPSQITVQSQQLEQQNPFLKRKSTNEQFEAKKKEIFDHVQKFGIKKKVQEKSHRRNKV